MISLWRQFLDNRLARQASHWALSTVLLTACSCSSARQKTASKADDPFLKHESATQVAANGADPADSTTRAGGKSRATSRAAASTETLNPRIDDRDEFDIGALPQAVPANDAADEQALADVADQAPRVHRGAIQQTAAEERCPEFCEGMVIDESPRTCAKLYPDEYLCDGGDREYPIHYQEDQMLGLESEDAAVEYRDDLGNRHVKPSNRVCVYSPRFAAVTAVTQPLEDVGGGRPVQAIASTTGVGLANREGTFAQHQRDASERLVTRSRGSGLTGGTGVDVVDRPIAIHGHVHTTTPALDFAFLRTGHLKQTEEARLAASIQSAAVWTRDQNPVITAKSEQAIVLKSEFKERELVGKENRFNGQGKLRIVKTADKSVAEPGDIVKFSIRYDNIGDREVLEVVIIDNLTPRMEYVEDSATCDRNGALNVEDNGEGSVVLRWVLDEPLPGGSGGVFTFQARVR
jgi:uncharacterized repeat protein (TIGR01451 family)